MSTRTRSAVVGTFFSALLAAAAARATPATITVDLGKPGVAVGPMMYGLMTEEINHSYDGGLLAELVQNRSFADSHERPVHWSVAAGSNAKAKMRLDYGDPVNLAQPASLRVDLGGGVGAVANDGYWGVPVKPDTTYSASFYAKGGDGFAGPVTAAIVTDDGNVTVAKAETSAVTDGWQKYTLTLKTGHDAAATAQAKFVLSATGTGCVWYGVVSLFPPTYQDKPNGLRPDLMKLMADLHPAFIRLPGGNYLEGDTFPTRFNWKQMIGPADQRPGHMGCWNYRSSDGFGLPEYLTWCEQLHAEPVLAVFAGFTLNHDHVPAGADLQGFVDDALEEIEYVAGPADSTWGKRRAADGHPEPFKLTYVEVGNEDFFDPNDGTGGYDGRFAQFFDAIKAKYPNLKIIATRPVNGRRPDVVDDHYYLSARQMAATADKYAKADRKGPEVFVGEWATQEGRPTPDLNAGLADAAWLMGMEKSADVVRMTCYAPLLVNVNKGAWQWPTNLIGYDAMASFGSPSYYAQAMIMANRGDATVPVAVEAAEQPVAVEPDPHGMFGVGVWHTNAEYKDVHVSNAGKTADLTDQLVGRPDGANVSGGRWGLRDGAVRPSAANSTSWVTAGDPKLSHYTVELKARKAAGQEGFMLLYQAVDGENFNWWNVGGWGNTRTQFEATHEGARSAFGPESTFKVEAGRWYDLKLEVDGRHVKGFVDGKLVTDATEEPSAIKAPLFASASTTAATGELVVKVVNLGSEPVEATVNLAGAGTVQPTGTATVLAGQPRDQNTVEQPTKVAPKQEPVTDAAATFKRTFPPHSFTLLKLKAAAK